MDSKTNNNTQLKFSLKRAFHLLYTGAAPRGCLAVGTISIVTLHRKYSIKAKSVQAKKKNLELFFQIQGLQWIANNYKF